MRTIARRVIAAAWTLPMIAMGAAQAHALPGGNWASSTSPLYVNSSGYGGTVSAAYGTFQGYREDQNRGSRIQDWSAHRDPNGNTSERGAYVNHAWYFDGNNCYVTSLSDSGGSIGCSTGWWSQGTTHTPDTESKSWQYYETWHVIDPTGSSGRAGMSACFDRVLASDYCSGTIYRGANY